MSGVRRMLSAHVSQANENVAREACRELATGLVSRKQPSRVLRAALVRVHGEDLSTEVLRAAFAAATFVAVSLFARAPWLDDETHAAVPRLRKPKDLENDVLFALEVVMAHSDVFADDARVLHEMLSKRTIPPPPGATTPSEMPLFTRPMSPALFASEPPPPPPLTSPGVVRAEVSHVALPFEDAAALDVLTMRLAGRALDDVIDEVFAPIFALSPPTTREAREAYALCALLIIWVGRMPARFLPREFVPTLGTSSDVITPAALGFARSVLERLELADGTLRLDAPDADLRGRVVLRVRALRRLLARDRVVSE